MLCYVRRYKHSNIDIKYSMSFERTGVAGAVRHTGYLSINKVSEKWKHEITAPMKQHATDYR